MDRQERLGRMLKTIAIGCTVAAALAFPATAPAALSQSDYKNASKFCKALKVDMTPALFKLAYGTNKNHSNAHGKCVSKHVRTVDKTHKFAKNACKAEREANAAEFALKYGSKKNALGKCVSSRAKALKDEDRNGLTNAARFCKSERVSMGTTAFTAKYGNKRNAFGKCVSSHAKDEEGTS